MYNEFGVPHEVFEDAKFKELSSSDVDGEPLVEEVK